MIDGQELSLRDLKPGTRLHATGTTTRDAGRRPDHDRWRRQGLVRRRPERHPHPAERREPPVQGEGRLWFIVNGQEGLGLRTAEGMIVKAEKIAESPRVELATRRGSDRHGSKTESRNGRSDPRTRAGTSPSSQARSKG